VGGAEAAGEAGRHGKPRDALNFGEPLSRSPRPCRLRIDGNGLMRDGLYRHYRRAIAVGDMVSAVAGKNMASDSREPVLVVVPTYKEATNIGRFLDTVFSRCPDAHVLVIDDCSPDGTADIVRGDRRFGASLFMIERPGKMGLGSAYIAGFKWALEREYEIMLEMDADFSHDPAEIPNFLAKIREGADLVLGSRYVGGVRVLNWPMSRLFLSLGAAHYVQVLTGMPVTDPTGGFKCFRRRVLEAINLGRIQSNGYAFQIEMTFWAWRMGFDIREIPIIFADRAAGTSKMSMAITREAIWQVMRLGVLRFVVRTRKGGDRAGCLAPGATIRD